MVKVRYMTDEERREDIRNADLVSRIVCAFPRDKFDLSLDSAPDFIHIRSRDPRFKGTVIYVSVTRREIDLYYPEFEKEARELAGELELGRPREEEYTIVRKYELPVQNGPH